jgi:transposase
MTCTAEQVRTLMRYANTGPLSIAAQKAGMSGTTATKYFKAGGRICKKDSSRIYPDAFAELWEEAEKKLAANPGLQAKTLLNWLMNTYPEKQFTRSQLRTLQRRIQHWRYLKGPDKEVMFRQQLYPGKQSQSDWTNCDELKVTIQKQEYPHLIFHFMMPYSGWEYGERSKSESFESLTQGYMRAVRKLGAVAQEHRTDHLSAAVNNHEKPHDFTPKWKDFLRYYGVSPSMNNLGQANENGSVEKAHDLLKDALDQALMLRGSRDFASVAEYDQFVEELINQRNKPREKDLKEELKVTKMVPLRDWNAPLVCHPKVDTYSLISVKGAVYSVENRLIGSNLTVLVYPDILRVFYQTKLVAELPRQPNGGKLIDWRQVVVPLGRKPGAFRNWRYRDDCFPSALWRQVYAMLRKWSPEDADKEYLRVLEAGAATKQEQDFQAALELLLEDAQAPDLISVQSLVGPVRHACQRLRHERRAPQQNRGRRRHRRQRHEVISATSEPRQSATTPPATSELSATTLSTTVEPQQTATTPPATSELSETTLLTTATALHLQTTATSATTPIVLAAVPSQSATKVPATILPQPATESRRQSCLSLRQSLGDNLASASDKVSATILPQPATKVSMKRKLMQSICACR